MYCSSTPRHRLLFDFRNEGSHALDDVDEKEEAGPGRCCSPRHRTPFNSRNQGYKCVSGVDDVAGNMTKCVKPLGH